MGGFRDPPTTLAGACEDRAMAHLRLIEVDEATGLLREEYDAAVARAGKVFNIVKAMSLGPAVLQALDGALPRGSCSGRVRALRQERELLAVVVSRANDCHY